MITRMIVSAEKGHGEGGWDWTGMNSENVATLEVDAGGDGTATAKFK